MKNFKGINIDNKKLMKDEELVALKGGATMGTCYACWGENGFLGFIYGTGFDEGEVFFLCESYYSATTTVFQTECP